MDTGTRPHDEIAIWLAAQNPVIHRQRHALARAYPAVALTLARPHENPTLLAISAAIDRGEALDAAVAALVGVSPPAVVRLENISPETITDEWIKHPIELFWAMDVLHPLNSPQTPEEWNVLRKLWINTGLEWDEAYRNAVGIGRERQVVLEYLFRGLCAQGYGEPVRTLADRLVAPLPGIETDPECIWQFNGYVSFVEMLIAPTILLKRKESWNGAERLLMRYPPGELIRQWESWRCIIAAHGDAGFENWSECEDMAKARWIMRLVVPDFDDAVRWVDCHPRQSASLPTDY
ncbi:MAG: hypothetical protein K9K30_01380 [Burkholderiaceae bacterium]|nr:hypothetical protein [Sulfuritalea sp.]MCF8173880.1 hypothetical protein [Burkholderiaceae bacterium]MCF8184548.1 hypothetical protein [Polynucleobacter sp.]